MSGKLKSRHQSCNQILNENFQKGNPEQKSKGNFQEKTSHDNLLNELNRDWNLKTKESQKFGDSFPKFSEVLRSWTVFDPEKSK